ncbi:probable low affinity copper uptake protein 2 isoform X2 [Aethina tumida]|uniref:probable low affinity copper uptake protein 2 isoform X2 n=1 Tax=Aethina tumida TaxID=116153 RepID=UPI00214742C2|nr:probable low affinity copper uptake protein 2 isoform X2 [Aethina tumida]
MKNAFFWGTDVGTYLFKGLEINSVGGLVVLCLLVTLMSFVFEYLRFLQTKHRQKELILRSKQLKQICTTESASLIRGNVDERNPLNITYRYRAMLFGTEVCLWLLSQNLGYILMLTVMVYDAWILVAAVIGGGIGYLIFGQKFMKINLQNCQIIRDTFCTQICGELARSITKEPQSSTNPNDPQ